MQLLNQTFTTAVSPAVATTPIQYIQQGAHNLCLQANFTYGSGGTTVDAYVQTTLDGGATWVDVAQFSFGTSSGAYIFNLSSATPQTTALVPTNGTLTAGTSVDGIFNSALRVLYKSSGTYAGNTTLRIDGMVVSRVGS